MRIFGADNVHQYAEDLRCQPQLFNAASHGQAKDLAGTILRSTEEAQKILTAANENHFIDAKEKPIESSTIKCELTTLSDDIKSIVDFAKAQFNLSSLESPDYEMNINGDQVNISQCLRNLESTRSRMQAIALRV